MAAAPSWMVACHGMRVAMAGTDVFQDVPARIGGRGFRPCARMCPLYPSLRSTFAPPSHLHVE
eukprot:364982-Chlamydomonas_euryale.AAC.1